MAIQRKKNSQSTKVDVKSSVKKNEKRVLSAKCVGRRSSTVSRNTSETRITVALDIDGTGKSSIKTGIAFLDHMLELFSRHGYFDVAISVDGDIDVDNHHTNEDTAISLGDAFKKALSKKQGICRYGSFYVPMDDVLVRVVLDISNRPHVCIDGFPQIERSYKPYNYTDCEHFLKSFAQSAGIDMHVSVLKGRDRHHIIEAVFKALARALDQATKVDTRNMSVPSTKGIL